MCNLNILFRKKMNSRVTPFLMSVSSNSFAENNHGEGIWISSNDKVHKSEIKMNLFDFEKEIEESKTIVSHQRFSTSGFEVKYNHPFVNSDFVLVHNGVINQFKNGEGSDTYGFWLRFNKEFNKITSHISREEKVIKVISELFEKNEGSYSILIYDKKTKQSFYFRGGNYPSIYFYDNDEYLFITTNGHNDNFLSMLTDKKFVQLDIKERKIYKINSEFKCFKSKDLLIEKQVEIEEKSVWEKPIRNRFGSEETGITCDVCNELISGVVYQSGLVNTCFDCWSLKNNKDYL